MNRKSRRVPAAIPAEILTEASKVLSAANEGKIKQAHGHLTEVLDSVKPSMAEESLRESSASAMDASSGAYVLASLLRIISDESDEGDQVKVLMDAYDSVAAWMKMELAEIGTDEDEQASPWESLRDLVADGLELRRLREAEESTSDINDLADDAFAYVEPGGKKDDSGKTTPRSKRHFPIHDAAHVRNALARASQSEFGDKAMPAIKAAAKKFGVDVTESQAIEITGDLVPLVEASAVKDGSARVKLIAPGWGSSGYYAPELLERDGPKVFTSGTKMFWDHPTRSEEAERPERSLKDLAAELTSTAKYDAAGPSGPGLYADAKVFGGFKEAVNELAPHIGVSIRALGKAAQGTVEGRTGPVIQSFEAAHSVDFVTSPGAGGQVLQLFEAARAAAHPTPLKEESTMTPEEQQKLTEAEQRAARLEAALILREAKDIITTQLAEAKVPDFVRSRLSEQLGANPPVRDGALDEAALAAQVKEAVAAEVAYLAKATGSGRVNGFGGSGIDSEESARKIAEATRVQHFMQLGMSEASAKVAAAGRV